VHLFVEPADPPGTQVPVDADDPVLFIDIKHVDREAHELRVSREDFTSGQISGRAQKSRYRAVRETAAFLASGESRVGSS
jgi:hypothetical protein